MTLPINIKFPAVPQSGNLNQYLEELTISLKIVYQRLAETINGDIFANAFTGSENWTPVLKDFGNDGTTFTYDHQIGSTLRQGIMTDCWFDVKWTANTGAITGNMYIDLPYKVALSEQKPFVGVCQPSIFAFTAGTECVLNAIPDTYRCEVWNTGDGFTTANQGSVAAGQLIGHIRYMGQEIER